MSFFALAGVIVPVFIRGMELSGGFRALAVLPGLSLLVAAPRTGAKHHPGAQALLREEEQEGAAPVPGHSSRLPGRQWAQGIFPLKAQL